MSRFANVILDISHEKLDKTFQYRVPEGLTAVLFVGAVVTVPFGNGNKLRSAYVVELTDVAEYDEAKLKEIAGLEESAVPVESRLIALAAWMRKNYGGTMSAALKTVLPVKKKAAQREKQVLILSSEKEAAAIALAEFTHKHHTAKARLLTELIEEERLPKELVTGKLHIGSQTIRSLEAEGFLRIETQAPDYRNPVKPQERKGKKQVLNPAQQMVCDTVLADYRNGEQKTYLLHGVTGSGKTEVYMELIAAVLADGKQAIVLIPEIALTYQTVLRFYARFGDLVSILHSKMSAGERYDQYLRAKAGEVKVMIGPRSALFTPFPKLGLIVIDEEHETSYKSETNPRYHARETAIERAKTEGAFVVLGSATPSLESYYRAGQGEYTYLSLPDRVEERPLPTCEIIDLRAELSAGNRSILSRRLKALLTERLEKREQSMLFLNRRGISGFVSCRSCGAVLKCPHCDVSLSLHRNGVMKCHYCGYETPAVKTCPSCGSKYIGAMRAGTEKIEELVKKEFPSARVLRMDFDTTREKDGYERILSAFLNREADILIGTQMIVKGHDFPYVTLVGVLAADLSLNASDFRAAERTFDLLTQAAGRAGRGERLGQVIIQTYHPGHYSITSAAAQDYETFYEAEIGYRRLLKYPPVWHLLTILVASKNEALAARYAADLAAAIQKDFPDVALIGPADAAIAKVNDIYKKIVFLKEPDYGILVRIKDFTERYAAANEERGISLRFDFDPMNGF